jgi:serine/threonine protein kinase
MELMEGSLCGLLGRGPIRRALAVGYFADAALGLAEVHRSAQGAFHGDVKLPNILFKNGSAKLADFGLARGGWGQTQMVGPHSGGTPGYVPPEGYTSSDGDVYSLGVALWAMLVGREPAANGPDVDPVLPPLLRRLLTSMLTPDPVARVAIDDVVAQLPAIRAESPDWQRIAGYGAIAVGAALLLGAAFAGARA